MLTAEFGKAAQFKNLNNISSSLTAWGSGNAAAYLPSCQGCNNSTALADCANPEVFGLIKRVATREPVSAETRQTRSALQDRGERMLAGLTLAQVTAVELTFESEVFMLGVVTTTKYTICR